MRKAQPEIAFMAAALVLLVVPMLVMFGLMALGLAAAVMVPMDRLTEGHGIWMLFALFIGWVILVIAIILMFIRRLVHTTRA